DQRTLERLEPDHVADIAGNLRIFCLVNREAEVLVVDQRRYNAEISERQRIANQKRPIHLRFQILKQLRLRVSHDLVDYGLIRRAFEDLGIDHQFEEQSVDKVAKEIPGIAIVKERLAAGVRVLRENCRRRGLALHVKADRTCFGEGEITVLHRRNETGWAERGPVRRRVKRNDRLDLVFDALEQCGHHGLTHVYGNRNAINRQHVWLLL